MSEDTKNYRVERKYLSQFSTQELIERIVRDHMNTDEKSCDITTKNIEGNR